MFQITDIYWQRVNLHIVFDKSLKGYNIYLVSDIIGVKKFLKLKSNNNELVINITNTPEGQMLTKGKWKLVIDKEEINTFKEYLKIFDKLKNNVLVKDDLLSILDDKSRIFKYRGGAYAYIVNFSMDIENNFYIYTNFMVENRKWKRFSTFRESGRFGGKLKILFKKLYVFLINFYYYISKIFSIFHNKKNVLFLTTNSDKLTGNLKILYDSIKKSECNKLVHSKDNYSSKNKNVFIRIVNYLRSIFLISISDVIIIDNYVSLLTHLHITKNTKIIQLWHAGVGFKAVGYARFGIEGSPRPYVSGHRKYNYVIVDNENLIDVYKEVFAIKESAFKAYGMPSLDGYLNKETINKVTHKLYKINKNFENKKVILFSPTYRGSGSETAFYDCSLLNQQKIYEFCKKNNFIFIIKMHPFIKDKININEEYKDIIIDYSNLEINDLIYVSDIMITDYSSCAYEFSLFNRPLIFYRFDKSLYEYLRPMHTIESFTKKQYEVKTFDELMDVLEKNKDVNIKERFNNLKKVENNNSCGKIKKLFLEK